MMNSAKKVSKKDTIIILLVASIVGLVLAGVVSYINYIDHKSNEPKYEKLDVSSELVQNLFMLTRRNMSGSILAGTDYENIYYRKDFKVSDMDEEFKMQLAYIKLDSEDYIYRESSVGFPASALKESYEKIFGDTIHYKDGDIYYICPSKINYDDSSKEYYYNEACGYIPEAGFENQLVEARRYDDYIAIYEKAVFYEIDFISDAMTYYRDAEHTDPIDGEEYDFNDAGISTYKYIFEKAEDGNYYFSEVKKENNI